MTTVINNPGDGSGDSSGMGVILGVIFGILLIVLFFVYGLPAIRGNKANDNGGIDINVDLPGGNGGGSTAPSGGTGY